MVSVIVPVYNIVKYLPKCLESIINQTFTDLEIILIDDGSTDGSSEICEIYRQRDPRVIVVHKENGGLVNARKAGMRVSSGKYIVYVDGDDWVEQDMCRQMYNQIIEQQVDVAVCGHYEDTGSVSKKNFHGIPEGKYDRRELVRSVYPRMIEGGGFFEWGIFPGMWGKMFKKECLEPFQFAVDDRITMGEDAACVYPCFLHVDSIYVMRECLYHYRQTATSMIKRIQEPEAEREQFRILYQSVAGRFKKDAYIFDLSEQWKKYLLFLMVPRADALLEGIGNLEYLFPFPEVKKGSSIILYGMGAYGQRLYRYIKQSGFCTIVMAADRNYAELKKQGLLVEAPERIAECKYDSIVVAISFSGVRNMVYHELLQNYPADKVHVMNEELIMSSESLKRFGLI